MTYTLSTRRRLAAQSAQAAADNASVAAVLDAIPPDWAVFHGMPSATRGLDTEHLLVGPGGVLTVTARLHHGEWVWLERQTVMVSGRRVSYLHDAAAEADRVTQALRERMPLRTPVRPVVALVGARFVTLRGKETPVKVVNTRDLQGWLVTLPPVLRPIERMELAAVIDNPVTWAARRGTAA